MEDTLVIDGLPIARFTVEGVLGEQVKDFELSFEVETEEQLRTVAAALGGIDRLSGSDRLWTYRPPGETYGCARSEGGRRVQVHVWLSPELAARPTPEPPTVIERLREEYAAERAAAENGGVGEPHVDNDGHDVHDAGGPTEQVRS